jgi:LmbE family N-acetylglucosaminyl deacetylase
MIFAPHCDDETLGTGGVIQAALKKGIDVRVVIATNGDGYLFATMEEFRRLFPTSSDYLHLGEIRQQESLDALSTLGLPADHVAFLGYPDRGTPALWNDHWQRDAPFQSPYTQTTRSPYRLTYDASAVYAGESLLSDLTSILTELRPDLVLYPHPDDVHPDHWGLSVFVRAALLEVEHADPTYRPTAYAYLVHRPDYPAPKRYLPTRDLVPPSALSRATGLWRRFDLTPEETSTKWQALQRYSSQLEFLRGLFEGFVRRNELFEPRDPLQLPQLSAGDPADPPSWQDRSGLPIAPLVLDPERDVVVRDAIASADLMATYAARTDGDLLLMCLETRGSAEAPLVYTLRVVGFASDGRHASVTSPGRRTGRFVCTQVALRDLGFPWVIFIGGEVRGPDVGILDQVAWEAVLR